MHDVEWLLNELERWRDPTHPVTEHAPAIEAVQSPEHQHLYSRLRHALRNGPVRPPDLPLPAPC
jgi:hypothetical protein